MLKVKLDQTGKYRSIISQVVACMCPNLLLLGLGMAISFTTIALPDLLDSSGRITLTDSQASWFGSIAYLCQPFGAVISGPLVDYIGRKKGSFLASIPPITAWIILYFSWNIPTLFIGVGLLGLGNGIMEAPINAYVGEISEPRIRGALCTSTQLFTSLGVFLMYFMGAKLHWRQAALYSLAMPVASVLIVFLIPETPVWLLSRNREKKALKSLCYLRGWTSPENVREEFDALTVFCKKLQQCVICNNGEDQGQCVHSTMNCFQRAALKIRYVMLSKGTLRPLAFVFIYFTVYSICGIAVIRPNMVNICEAFGMKGGGKNIVNIVGIITFATGVLTMGLIKLLGKRKLTVISMLGAALSCFSLSIYAKTKLDENVFSYEPSTFPTDKSNVPAVLFVLFMAFNGCCIPWVFLGEVFPFRSRASAQGLVAALYYVVSFAGAKTYINVEMAFGLWGTFAFYGAIGVVGTIYLYFFTPETEGKTLLEIETYYSGDFRIFADDPFINVSRRIKKRLC